MVRRLKSKSPTKVLAHRIGMVTAAGAARWPGCARINTVPNAMSLEHIRHYLAERAFQTFSNMQLADVRKCVGVSLHFCLQLSPAPAQRDDEGFRDARRAPA